MQTSRPQIFLFHGEEDFLIDEKIRELKAGFANHETLDGENLTLESLSSALCSHSLFGGEKLIVIRDAVDQDELISRLENIAPGTTVVFRLPAVDKRSKFFKWIDEHGEVEEFRTFAPWEQHELAGWIKDCVRRGGKKISEGAARLLIEICGSNLRSLANETEKLITDVGGREEVREADVEALASPGEISAFALLDALRAKDLGRSLSLFQVLVRNGQDLFSLLGLIASQFRLMLQIKSLPEREREPGRLARVVRGSPYFIRRCSDNLGRFTLEELKENLSRLAETSLQLKTGAQQPVVFELLLASLCGN
jgi:DNA polymerase-3 subunit delta